MYNFDFIIVLYTISRMNKLLYIIALVALFSCSSKQGEQSMKKINQILDEYYEERLQMFPLEATAIADTRYNDQLPADISDSYRDKLMIFYRKYLNEIKKVEAKNLSDEERISYDTFLREMEMQIAGLKFKDNLMPVNQFWSMHLTFPVLGSGSGNQPFATVKDYNDFLKRIDAYVAYNDTAIENMRRGMNEGIVPPALLMERVLPQLQGIIVKDPKESAFYGPLNNFPKNFSEDNKKDFTVKYTDAIQTKIVPAYQKMYDFIKNEYIPKCRTTTGISDIPEGKEMYAHLAKVWTTTDLTPDQIFEIGQKEVARIRAEMENVMRETNFKGDLKDFFHFIHTDKKFFPFKQDSDVINYYRSIETRMQPQLKKLFNMVPKAKFEVRQTEKFREASASAEYNQSAPDGSRPGIFYVPVLDATKYSVVGMEDLFLHEAIPGHHYQISIQQENDSLPKFRRFGWYGAYGEGWALYTESLGKELGLYTDPYQYFGSLSEEMHRAIRLVVDVGMHMKGWTREEAIKFSMENEAESESDITSEIERYMAIPGQALAYKIGQLKLLEIRKKAEEKLGDKFSIQAFHDEVLKDGCLPLDVLERKMERWMQNQNRGN
jgi:uncharacterized protein (DUF885 family)